MANGKYKKSRKKFLDGDLDWLAQDFRAVLVDTGAYTVDLDNHEFLSDIPLAARIGTSGNLSGKTSTSGIADATDETVTGVSGNSVEAVAIIRWSGDAATSELICYIDSGTGFPYTPNGGNVNLQWAAGGIFTV